MISSPKAKTLNCRPRFADIEKDRVKSITLTKFTFPSILGADGMIKIKNLSLMAQC